MMMRTILILLVAALPAACALDIDENANPTPDGSDVGLAPEIDLDASDADAGFTDVRDASDGSSDAAASDAGPDIRAEAGADTSTSTPDAADTAGDAAPDVPTTPERTFDDAFARYVAANRAERADENERIGFPLWRELEPYFDGCVAEQFVERSDDWVEYLDCAAESAEAIISCRDAATNASEEADCVWDHYGRHRAECVSLSPYITSVDEVCGSLLPLFAADPLPLSVQPFLGRVWIDSRVDDPAHTEEGCGCQPCGIERIELLPDGTVDWVEDFSSNLCGATAQTAQTQYVGTWSYDEASHSLALFRCDDPSAAWDRGPIGPYSEPAAPGFSIGRTTYRLHSEDDLASITDGFRGYAWSRWCPDP